MCKEGAKKARGLIPYATILVVLLAAVSLVSATDITTCQTITSEGYYRLTQNVTSTATCFTIQSNNVEIDCQGYTIQYGTDGANTRLGVDATYGSNNMVNLTVRNCNIQKGASTGANGFGIRMTRFSNSQIINNTILTNGTTNNHAIYMTTSSSGNLIENNTITAFGSSSGSNGIYILSDSRNNVIRNNEVTTQGTATNYALQLATNADSNLVENNNFSLYASAATSNGHTVYITSSYYNNITGNNIYSQGVATNYAVYLATNADSNLISDNDIVANGSGATNYGFYASSSDSNTIEYNRITTSGGGNNNYGLRINAGGESVIQYNNITTVGGSNSANIGISLTTSDLNIVRFNAISTSGAANNYGLQVSQSSQNNITDNEINATGTTTGNNGVYLTTNANENILADNEISAFGSTSNYGVYVYSIASSNTVRNNTVSTNGTTRSGNTFNHGLYISTTSKNNEITDNTVSTDGGNANYGVNIYTDADNNIIENNSVSSDGDGANNYGIYVYSSNNNTVGNNTVSTNGTGTDHGVYIHGGSTSNVVTDNTITTLGGSTSNAFHLLYANPSYPNNNNFSRNELASIDGNDLNIATASIDGTSLIDQMIDTYLFTGIGSTMTIINSSYSKITFTDRLTGSGSGFSDSIKASENFAEVDSTTKTEFNKSADITIYGLPTTFTKLAVFRDGVVCPPEICTNLTSMQAGNVTFNVTGWSNYTIQSTDPLPPIIIPEYPEDGFNSSSQNVTFNFTVIDETSLTMACTLYLDGNSSGTDNVANNTIGSIATENITEGSHVWNISCYDEGGNLNTTSNRTLNVDITPPTISVISYTPSSSTDIDPGENITFVANITDALSDISSAILEYFDGSSWSNITMTLIGSDRYSANLTLSSSETNYTFNIWANDSFGNSRTSSNQTLSSAWDCTWEMTSDLGGSAGFDETKHIGYLVVNNTGDVEFPNANCTLDFRVTYNLQEGRILYDGESFKNLQLPSGSIQAGENATVNISAVFKNEISEEQAIITLSEFRGRSTTPNNNATATIVSTTGGPYLYHKISSSPTTVLLTPGSFSLQTYIRDLMGDGTENNTAYNVTSSIDLPSGFSISSGDRSANYPELTDNSFNYNNLSIDISSENVATISPGIMTITLSSYGYDKDGNIIIHSENRTTLTESVNITLECNNESDGVYVIACGSLDGDYVAPTNTIQTQSGGSGGGGGSSGYESVETSADYQLIRGKENEIKIKFTNPDKENPIEKIKFSFSSPTIGKYIEIYPTKLDEIAPGGNTELTLKITSPTYIELGSHKVRITLIGQKARSKYADTKNVELQIHELTADEADRLLRESGEDLKKFSESGFSDPEIDSLLEESRKAMENFDYEKVRDNHEAIHKATTSAMTAEKIINELTDLITLAEKKQIKVSGSKRIMELASLALARGDYEKALERAKEAQVTYALETSGKYGAIGYYVKTYPEQISGAAIFLALFSFGTYKVSRLQKLKYRIKRLKEEEKIINELIKVVQNETFNEKKMGMDEYRDTMNQYERKLSSATEKLIKYETERAYLLRFTGKRKRLSIEREKILELIKQIQKEYLQDAKIETHSYNMKLNSYNKRLSEIDQTIATLEAKNALKKMTNTHMKK